MVTTVDEQGFHEGDEVIWHFIGQVEQNLDYLRGQEFAMDADCMMDRLVKVRSQLYSFVDLGEVD